MPTLRYVEFRNGSDDPPILVPSFLIYEFSGVGDYSEFVNSFTEEREQAIDRSPAIIGIDGMSRRIRKLFVKEKIDGRLEYKDFPPGELLNPTGNTDYLMRTTVASCYLDIDEKEFTRLKRRRSIYAHHDMPVPATKGNYRLNSKPRIRLFLIEDLNKLKKEL